MNTVNSVNIWDEKGLISVGSRDGVCRFFDLREPIKPIYSLQAHAKGINKVDFSTIDQTFYTSGRDNRINIWDIRQLKESKKSSYNHYIDGSFTPKPLYELNRHMCESHHIQSGYMLNSRYIITGSEENLVRIIFGI